MSQMLTWRVWVRGVLAAAINGVASGIVLIIAAPETFNFETGWPKLWQTSALLGLLGMANYLKTNPLPEWDGTERRDRRDDDRAA